MAATDLLRVSEVAQRLGTTEGAVYVAVGAGRLPAFRVPCPRCSGPPRLLIPVAAVDLYAANRRTRVPADVRDRIRALGASGLGATAIARVLAAEGVRAPGGRAWLPRTVRRALVEKAAA